MSGRINLDNMSEDFKSYIQGLESKIEQIENEEKLKSININSYSNLVIDNDWTVAIQTAIKYATENNKNWRGIEIIFPRGTYNISQIYLSSGVRLKGVAKGGVFLKQIENTNKDMIVINSAYGASINDIVIDGNKINQSIGNGIVIYKNLSDLPVGADINTTMRLLDLTGTWIKDIKGSGLVCGKDNGDNTGSSTGAWVFNISNCFISDCDGYGIKNFTTDNGFTNIDIYNCNMGAVYNSTGDNTRYLGGKWYLNGKNNITKGSLNIVNSKRVVFTSVDIQDNYGHGVYIDGGYNISFNNVIVDNAGYHRYVEGQNNRVDENLLYILNSTNVTFNGMLENYMESRGLKVKYAITIQNSTNTTFNAKSSGIERILNSVDGSYVDFISKPCDNFNKVNGVKSGDSWCLLATLILDNPYQSTIYKTNLYSVNFGRSFELIVHIFANDSVLERGNSFINCISNYRDIASFPSQNISNEIYAGVYNTDEKLFCDIWVNVKSWDSLWYSNVEVFTHDRDEYLKIKQYNHTYNDMYDNPFSTTSLDKSKYVKAVPINIL